jgi:hypothetical protein
MAKKPAYFDSQASAAAALKIDISRLRDAKRQGCGAFRSGRVYRAQLLAWFEEKRRCRGSSAAEEDDLQPQKSHWDRERARVDYERALFSLEVEKRKHVELAEICGAVGQMLAGFRTAINMLPGSAARWLIGLNDFHVIKNKLQSEVDGVLQSLGRCRYLEELAPAVIERVLKDRPKEYRDDVRKSVAAVFIEVGREALMELQIDVDEPPAE